MHRKIFDKESHAHFVTFSCYRRQRILDDDQAKRIVIHFLSGLIDRPENWKFSSARFYLLGKPVGVPITKIL
jgi:REP element-mobilizing transposase RayT